MRKTTKEHLMAQLLRSGLPLEVEASQLMDKDWLVLNNQAYVDDDLGKSREVDIFGIHDEEADDVAFDRLKPFFVATDMAVECKRSESHAWVFLTRPKAQPPGFGSGQVLDFDQVFTVDRRRFLEKFDLPKLHYDDEKRVAHAGVQLKLQGQASAKDEIFEASQQLMKFTFDFMNGRKKLMLEDNTRRDIIFLALVIIFDGELYEATIEKGKRDIQPREHILLRSQRYSKTGEYSDYLIDVVRWSHFPSFLSILNEDAKSLRRIFRNRYGELLAKSKALWPS